jgi:MoxR-like ATPase
MRISNFFREVQDRFVERGDLIRILKYAFVLREHVLTFGPPGTAKTAIADTITQHIEGAKAWSCDLSQFMAETRIFGDFDVRTAQESGQLLHLTKGSILDAHFANLGEFLDANTALLRSLLRVLNEREFIRGPQHLLVPLMTAIANTNLDPTTVQEKRPELHAVLDRFLFWQKVDYVKEPGNRLKMLKIFKDGHGCKSLPQLNINDIELVSGVVLRTNLLSNEFILMAYEELARRFAELRGRPVSDRRLNKGVQILDASAVLDGVFEVDWDDLDRTSLVLVDHAEEQAKFNEALHEVKTKWQDQAIQSQTSNEIVAIEGLVGRMPKYSPTDTTDPELVTMKRELNTLKKDIVAITTTSSAGAAKRDQALSTVQASIDQVQARIDQA